jgi:hypothetical protein
VTVAIAAPDAPNEEPAQLTLREWAAQGAPVFEHGATPALLHHAPLEVAEAAFRTFFAGIPFNPVALLRYGADGWTYSFEDQPLGHLEVRVQPQRDPEFTDPQLEIRTNGCDWRTFKGRGSLHVAIEMLGDLPF